MTTPDVPVQGAELTREAYDASVRENFKFNGPLGIFQGMLLYLDLGLHDIQVVIPSFLFAITGSNTFVGLASTLGLFANSLPQLFGVALVEHLPVKKPAMLRFGILSGLCWVIIGIATYFLPGNALLYTFLFFQALATAFYGLYLLVWQDIMSKIIPVERRGNYFGVRNFFATMASAGGVILAGYILDHFAFPVNYSIAFFLGSVFYILALFLLAMTREPASWRTSEKESTKEKLKTMPGIFKNDPNFSRFCFIRAVGAGFCQMATPFYILFAAQRLGGGDIGRLVAYLGTTAAVSRAVSNLFWGAVAQKTGYKVPLQLSFSIYAIAAVVALLSRSFIMFVLVFTINGLASAGLMMSTLNIMMEFGQIQTRTTYIAISTVISGLIGGLAPLMGGFLSDFLSYQALFVITAAVSGFSTLAMVKYVTDPRFVQEYTQ